MGLTMVSQGALHSRAAFGTLCARSCCAPCVWTGLSAETLRVWKLTEQLLSRAVPRSLLNILDGASQRGVRGVSFDKGCQHRSLPWIYSNFVKINKLVFLLEKKYVFLFLFVMLLSTQTLQDCATVYM